MAASAALARAIRTVGRRINSRPDSVITTRVGTIKTVTAGAAADGNAAAVVTIKGNDIPAPYDESYTPVVGHLVIVLLVDNSPLILGHIIGLPVV